MSYAGGIAADVAAPSPVVARAVSEYPRAAIRNIRQFAFALLVAGGVAIVAAAGGPAGTDARNGGTFRIAVAVSQLDSLDPALSYSTEGWELLNATCARLMTHPDRPAPAGLRLVPEVAAAYPASSRHDRTWTFKLRSGFRFSDGAPVRANAFARAIYRTLAPPTKAPGAQQYTQDIVGAADLRAGRTKELTGVTARGNTLVVRFTRAVPVFPKWTAFPFFCAVPPALPVDAEGRAVFASAGPYTVAEYRPGERAVLERNRFYGGTRPHHVDRFVVDLQASSFDEVLDRVESGDADWGWAPPVILLNPDRGLAAKYGVNRSQFFRKPNVQMRGFAMNTSRPLFRDNLRVPETRFALDHAAALYS